jgi:hypothetical protein
MLLMDRVSLLWLFGLLTIYPFGWYACLRYYTGQGTNTKLWLPAIKPQIKSIGFQTTNKMQRTKGMQNAELFGNL